MKIEIIPVEKNPAEARPAEVHYVKVLGPDTESNGATTTPEQTTKIRTIVGINPAQVGFFVRGKVQESHVNRKGDSASVAIWWQDN